MTVASEKSAAVKAVKERESTNHNYLKLRDTFTVIKT